MDSPDERGDSLPVSLESTQTLPAHQPPAHQPLKKIVIKKRVVKVAAPPIVANGGGSKSTTTAVSNAKARLDKARILPSPGYPEAVTPDRASDKASYRGTDTRDVGSHSRSVGLASLSSTIAALSNESVLRRFDSDAASDVESSPVFVHKTMSDPAPHLLGSRSLGVISEHHSLRSPSYISNDIDALIQENALLRRSLDETKTALHGLAGQLALLRQGPSSELERPASMISYGESASVYSDHRYDPVDEVALTVSENMTEQERLLVELKVLRRKCALLSGPCFGVPLAVCPPSYSEAIIPYLLSRCMQDLEIRGNGVDDPFDMSCVDMNEVASLRRRFTDEIDLPLVALASSPYVSAQLMREWFFELPSPFIPHELLSVFLDVYNHQASDRIASLQHFLASLPVRCREILRRLLPLAVKMDLKSLEVWDAESVYAKLAPLLVGQAMTDVQAAKAVEIFSILANHCDILLAETSPLFGDRVLEYPLCPPSLVGNASVYNIDGGSASKPRRAVRFVGGEELDPSNILSSSSFSGVTSREEDGGSLADRGISSRQPCPCGSGKKYKDCHGKRKKNESWYARNIKRVKLKWEMGETIFKNHRSWDLMVNLKLGIRMAVSGALQWDDTDAGDALPTEEFTRTRVENFPREGSIVTPPHESLDFKFKDYCPVVFKRIREISGVSHEDYMSSICSEEGLRHLNTPGKSGALFYFSPDMQYLIKTVEKGEMAFLRQFLPHYYEHLNNNPNSLLTRFFGLHRVKPKNLNNIRVAVMKNFFNPFLDIHERFDLKGSTQGRFTPDAQRTRENVTLKDLDLKANFYLPKKVHMALSSQVIIDSNFLASMQVMDYSMLLGLHYIDQGNQVVAHTDPNTGFPVLEKWPGDEEFLARISRGESSGFTCFEQDAGGLLALKDGTQPVLLFVGIIDILQVYGLFKRSEHVLKWIRYDRDTISVSPPDRYAARLQRFITGLFHDCDDAAVASKTMGD